MSFCVICSLTGQSRERFNIVTDRLHESTVWASKKSASVSLLHTAHCSMTTGGAVVLPRKSKAKCLKTLNNLFNNLIGCHKLKITFMLLYQSSLYYTVYT